MLPNDLRPYKVKIACSETAGFADGRRGCQEVEVRHRSSGSTHEAEKSHIRDKAVANEDRKLEHSLE